MWELLVNQWGWIADDSFLWNKWEFLDLTNIDVRETARKMKMNTSIEWPIFFTCWYTANAPMVQSIETTSWLATIKSNGSTTNYVYLDWTDKTAIISGWWASVHKFERIEFANDQFFIFTNNTTNNNIFVLNTNMGTLNSTKDTIAWSQPNLPVTASCPIYNDKIWYSKWNQIHEIDVASWAISSTAKLTIPKNSVIKLLYFNNDSLYVLSTLNNDTYCYIAIFNGSTLTLRYEKKLTGYTALKAIGDNGIIWVTTVEWIFQFNWDFQFVKAVTLTSSQDIAYNKNILKIVNWNNYYEYGHTKPWYNNILTKRYNESTLYVVTKNYVWVREWWVIGDRMYLEWQTYYEANGTATTLPYMAGEYGMLKKGLFIRFGCQFPVYTYTSGATQASIVVSVQTDEMERNSALFATVSTITDHSTKRVEIGLNEINKALWTAWYSSDFQYLKVKLQLNAWENVTISGGDTKYRVTPSIFDFIIKHDEIKND